MVAWAPLARMSVSVLLILAYEWISPTPINRWVLLGLVAAAAVPFERLWIRREAAEAPPVERPVKFTPRVFWSVAALLSVGFLVYMASPLLARHPDDEGWIRGAFLALWILYSGYVGDRVGGGAS